MSVYSLRPAARPFFLFVAMAVGLALAGLGGRLETALAMPPGGGPAGGMRITNSLGMELVLIPAGRFSMGSPPGEEGRDPDEGPQHLVEITRPFYLGATEVTQGQWLALMDHNPSRFPHCGPDCPVETVTWEEAEEFIRRLNQREGVSKYRLPSEAEWEYACRAGAATRFSHGDDDARLGDHAWYVANSQGSPHPVATRKPNPWGLHDMHGNVWEWCADGKREYRAKALIDPRGREGGERAIRGGSWNYGPWLLRSAYRFSGASTHRYNGVGLRVARNQ